MKKYILIYILSSIVVSQYWNFFHSEELKKYQKYNTNFEEIDRIAQLKINQNNHSRNALTHEIVGYLPYWEYSTYPNLDFSLITQLNYFSAELNQYGEITNNHNWDNLYLIEYAQNYGVKVKLCVTLFGENELNILLSNSEYRENAINNILEKILLQNANGVDINFELLPSSQRNNLVVFMEELSNTLHQFIDNPIITMATPAIDWNNAWDYHSLAEITDGLFIMGYNYFYSGSSFAGPVSPLGEYYYDLEYTINDYLNKTENQTDKLILGLPYYGYNWPVINNNINSETIDNGNAETYYSINNLLDNNANNWHANTNSSWFSYADNHWWQCWYDDSLSLSNKYEFAKNNNLKGIGIWALGYDSGHQELWNAIAEKFTTQLVGDLNLDNSTNILDVIVMINMILEFIESSDTADLNEDQIINIIDVITLINIILAQY